MLTRSPESGEKHRNTRNHEILLLGGFLRASWGHRDSLQRLFVMHCFWKSKLKSIGIGRKVEICCSGDFMSKKKASGHAEAKNFDAWLLPYHVTSIKSRGPEDFDAYSKARINKKHQRKQDD